MEFASAKKVYRKSGRSPSIAFPASPADSRGTLPTPTYSLMI